MTSAGKIGRMTDTEKRAKYVVRWSLPTPRAGEACRSNAIPCADAARAFAEARIFECAPDGAERPIPSHEDALAELDRLRADALEHARDSADQVHELTEARGESRPREDALLAALERAERDVLLAGGWVRRDTPGQEGPEWVDALGGLDGAPGVAWPEEQAVAIERKRRAIRPIGLAVAEALLRLDPTLTHESVGGAMRKVHDQVRHILRGRSR